MVQRAESRDQIPKARGHWLLISLGTFDGSLSFRFLWAGDFVVENR
jgi:hypothetical protein